ncbi:hypothetical protein ACFL7M_09160 [Thermodesulfobacteriota bacterium]
MTTKKDEIIKALEDSIIRLEEVFTSVALISDTDGIEIKGDSPLDVADDIEGAEAALMIAESRIEEMTQVLGEAIENLRTLMEKIEEGME